MPKGKGKKRAAKPASKTSAAASPAKKIRIVLYCPSEIILSGILKTIDACRDIEISAVEKNTVESFIEAIKRSHPQVVLFFGSEPLLNIREICKAIQDVSTASGKSRLLLMGNIPSHEEIVSLINAGARGYFDLNDNAGQLTEAVRVVDRGEIWLPRDKMSSIMDRIISVVGRDMKEKTLDQLTPTEFQVLRLIGQGKSNDEIAEMLFISKNTVRSHIKSIYAKLDTHSRLQLALYAINSALF